MAEYIDREAMLEDFESCNRSNPKWTPQRVKTLIVRQPPADAVPVIRCKDCKWYERDKQKGGFCRKPDASMWSPGLPIDELKPDDYCSRAKRKDDTQWQLKSLNPA